MMSERRATSTLLCVWILVVFKAAQHDLTDFVSAAHSTPPPVVVWGLGLGGVAWVGVLVGCAGEWQDSVVGSDGVGWIG